MCHAMSASISEVASNCLNESQITTKARTEAEDARSLMAKLDSSAIEVGKIVSVINSIAGRTNLLALNASIEAASAGEAGKGFAVVANEVKELARQTSLATTQIRQQIEEMQVNTKSAICGIEGISNIVEEIDQISHTIVCAVEEQSATIGELAKNISNVSESASLIATNVGESAGILLEVSSNIRDVSGSAESTSKGVQKVNENAKNLDKLADDLNDIVGKFKV